MQGSIPCVTACFKFCVLWNDFVFWFVSTVVNCGYLSIVNCCFVLFRTVGDIRDCSWLLHSKECSCFLLHFQSLEREKGVKISWYTILLELFQKFSVTFQWPIVYKFSKSTDRKLEISRAPKVSQGTRTSRVQRCWNASEPEHTGNGSHTCMHTWTYTVTHTCMHTWTCINGHTYMHVHKYWLLENGLVCVIPSQTGILKNLRVYQQSVMVFVWDLGIPALASLVIPLNPFCIKCSITSVFHSQQNLTT